LTRQLLAFSRQQWIQPIDLNLNQLIADLMKLLRRVIGADIDLQCVPANDLGLIHADPGQIEQILVNLCINARDAMPEGGTLVIQTENIICPGAGVPDGLVELKTGAYACLTVTDSGNGIDATTLDHIFEPFFTTKDIGHGTGLGLATVYGIVQQHQGVIHVESEPGTGSTFKIFIPIVQSEQSENLGEADDHDAKLEGNETILVAEDEERVRNLTRRILGLHGYRVLTASDGEEALKVFKDHSQEIQLALLDIVMPKMGGRAVVTRLHELSPGLPIFLTTGYSSISTDPDFTPAENVHLLRKPYQTSELLKEIRKVLDHQLQPR
jgi:CheY-like chemotaxis protein